MQSQSVTVTINNVAYHAEAPTSWDALSQRQLLDFYLLVFSPNVPADSQFQAGMTNLQLLILVNALLGISKEDLSVWEQDCLEANGAEFGPVMFAAELRSVVHALIGGLFDITEDAETKQTTYAVKLNRSVCPYPELVKRPPAGRYRSKRLEAQHTKKYYAPADGLGNLTIYELAAAFSRFEAYLATNDERHALELLAILYRPPKLATKDNLESAFEGDIRLPYRKREGTTAQRVPLMATLPLLARRVILFWFASCRAQIVRQYPKVFSAPAGEGDAPGYGWGGVLLSVAGGPAGLEAVADQHYSNVLTWLSMKAEEADELERRLAKAGR